MFLLMRRDTPPINANDFAVPDGSFETQQDKRPSAVIFVVCDKVGLDGPQCQADYLAPAIGKGGRI
jgi:hypothetical protein